MEFLVTLQVLDREKNLVKEFINYKIPFEISEFISIYKVADKIGTFLIKEHVWSPNSDKYTYSKDKDISYWRTTSVVPNYNKEEPYIVTLLPAHGRNDNICRIILETDSDTLLSFKKESQIV